MKINSIKPHLNNWEKRQIEIAQIEKSKHVPDQTTKTTYYRSKTVPNKQVAGGNILRTPVDRTAAMVILPAPWWAKDLTPSNPIVIIPKKDHNTKKKKMKSTPELREIMEGNSPIHNQDYVSAMGVRVKFQNGEPLICKDDVRDLLVGIVKELPKETSLHIREAEESRQVLKKMVDGFNTAIEDFKSNSKIYLEDIRQTRFAVVNETNQMTSSLKDIRKFFLGPDYKDEISRLREFVDLCERLYKLKESGFIDSIADTMLKLSER